MKKTFLLGVDIGGTKTAVILGDSRPSIQDRLQFETDTEKDPEETVRLISEKLDYIRRKNKIEPEEISGIGVSCGGPLDREKGLILSPPNLPGWDRVPITRLLTSLTGFKTYLENDANAGALAEWYWGAGKGVKNLVFLTFGTGMGAGLILNGDLYSGAGHMAGEAGHIRLTEYGPSGFGKPGSFEGYCSGGGIAQIARTEILSRLQRGEHLEEWRERLDTVTAEDVGKAAEENDPVALSIFETVGKYLGKGIAIIVDLLNPRKIILGSIYVRCSTHIEAAMKETFLREALPAAADNCEIVPATLGETIGDYSCLAIAVNSQEREKAGFPKGRIG